MFDGCLKFAVLWLDLSVWNARGDACFYNLIVDVLPANGKAAWCDDEIHVLASPIEVLVGKLCDT